MALSHVGYQQANAATFTVGTSGAITGGGFLTAGGGSGTSLSNNDLVLACLMIFRTGDTDVVTPPAGWTLAASVHQTATNTLGDNWQQLVYYHFYATTDTTYTWTWTHSAAWAIEAMAFRGVPTSGSPLDICATATTTYFGALPAAVQTWNVPATAQANEMIALFDCNDAGHRYTTVPSGWTFDYGSTEVDMLPAYATFTSSGAQGTVVITSSNTGDRSVIMAAMPVTTVVFTPTANMTDLATVSESASLTVSYKPSVEDDVSMSESVLFVDTVQVQAADSIAMTETYVASAFRTVAAADIQWFYSGGASNATPDLSLGGAISSAVSGSQTANGITSNTIQNVWDNVTSTQASTGETTYVCLYVSNRTNGGRVLQAPIVWIDGLPSTPNSGAAVGLDPAGVNGTAMLVANNGISPTGVTFIVPTTQSGGLQVGDLNPGDRQAVWMRRTIASGSPSGSDQISVRVQGLSI